MLLILEHFKPARRERNSITLSSCVLGFGSLKMWLGFHAIACFLIPALLLMIEIFF
jgi:hypothetical protein